MKALFQSAMIGVAVGWFAWTTSIRAADKATSIDFAGWLTAVDLDAKTITVKGKKAMIFTIDMRQCDIVRNGNGSTGPAQLGGLKNARVGDAVVGKLSLAESSPVVVRLDFTANPRFGLPIPNKPGFILTPYTSAIRAPLDVRGYPRGAMVKDPLSGKIILIP